jgi:dethiobiotin synthetase
MKLFVTGISTDVGKTVASAIITEALEADYWKPLQSGDLHHTDSDKVRALISNNKSVIHPEAYCFQMPASPHASAAAENIKIDLSKISEPKTKNKLVIEGAGGLLVPLDNEATISDLIKPDYKVIVVSRHYLGSINHTLLTIESLKLRKKNIAGILFSGDEHPTTESIIAKMSGCKILGRINQEPYFDQNIIREYADEFRDTLKELE